MTATDSLRDRLARSGDTPKARSEAAALARLDASRSSATMYEALREMLRTGDTSIERQLAVSQLIEQALADEYESGLATGYAEGFRKGQAYDPARAPFLG